MIHNSEADLLALLGSLDRAEPGPAQVVIVDAGSTDAGPALARERGCTVTRAGNVGFGAANNAGIALVDAPVTLLLNPDIVAHDPGSLGRLARLAADEDSLHAPRLLNVDGSVQDTAHSLPGSAAALLAALLPSAVLPASAAPWRGSKRSEPGWVIAAALAARTETLRSLGPFDPGQFLFYEDLDLGLRARASGVATVLHPEIHLTHRGGHSTDVAYGGEPYALLARRRREVIGERLGTRALRRDDLFQALTLRRSLILRTLTGSGAARPREQLDALRAARRSEQP